MKKTPTGTWECYCCNQDQKKLCGVCDKKVNIEIGEA